MQIGEEEVIFLDLDQNADNLQNLSDCGVVWLAGNTVWSIPERIRGEVLTTMRYTNRLLPFISQGVPFPRL